MGYEEIRNKAMAANATLVAVSKTKPIKDIEAVYATGQRDFGENKVQEMMEKYDILPKDIRWHLIGHLQSNKVKYIAPYVALIHSVDRKSLLETINKEGQKCDRQIPILLQLYIAQEDTKHGGSQAEIEAMTDEIASGKYPYVQLKGLMGMASFVEDILQIQAEFAMAKQLFDALQYKYPALGLDTLSMGMSGDFELALASGSNMIRVGSLIFGHRS